MVKVIVQGGFNTGRLYSDDGQKIYYWQFDDGILYFRDLSRGIDGFLRVDEVQRHFPVIPGWLMRQYDNNQHAIWPDDVQRYGHRKLAVPAGYDFGPLLRI